MHNTQVYQLPTMYLCTIQMYLQLTCQYSIIIYAFFILSLLYKIHNNNKDQGAMSCYGWY